MTGGALLAQMIAAELELGFSFAERIVTDRPGMYPIDYRVPAALRNALSGKRVALVDDGISAGSAVASTLKDLASCGARTVVLGALIIVGERPDVMAREKMLPLERLVEASQPIWAPDECPMCRAGVSTTPI
jgi:orotate phosphoribosyltransferase